MQSTSLKAQNIALNQFQLLHEASRLLTTAHTVADVLNHAVRYLTQLTQAHSTAIWFTGKGGLQLQTCSHPETTTYHIPRLTNESSQIFQALQRSGTTAVTRATLSPNSIDHDFLNQIGVEHLLAIPLVIQDTVTGLVTLHGQEAPIRERLDAAAVLIQQTAAAIYNAQLQEQVQQLNQTLERRLVTHARELAEEKERQEMIYQITSRLTKTLDLHQLINQTLQQLAEVVNAPNGVIMLNEDSYSNDLFSEAILNKDAASRPSEQAHDFLSHWIMRQRQAILMDDLDRDERLEEKFDHIRSIVAAPITADHDSHGVLLLSHPDPNAFTSSQLRLVEAVAVQLAAAINNARLHDYVRSQVIRLGDMLHRQEVEDSQKKAILASITDGVIASDHSGNIILINPAAEKILRSTESNLIGQPIKKIFEIFDPAGREKILTTLASLQQLSANQQEEIPFEIARIHLQSDRRIISAHVTVALTSVMETLGAVTVLRDITKEVEADRAKSEFISTVSHELRTPMTSIKGYADFLRQGAVGPLQEQQKHFLDVIRRNADRLSLLINDLLDVSRIEAGKVKLDLKETQLVDLVGNVVETMLIPAQNKGLTLTTEAKPNLPTVYADHDRLTQVLTNLIGNAINYTEAGGVHISLWPKDDQVAVSIKDTGVGIGDDVLPHIFDRFYRSDHSVVQATPGTGLGLSIVKAFIELHNGELFIDSKVNKGSIFTFTLPAIKEDQFPPK